MSTATKSKRHAWLECEVTRLSNEIEGLADENVELKEEAEGLQRTVSSPTKKRDFSKVQATINPDQIHMVVESQQDERAAGYVTDEEDDHPVRTMSGMSATSATSVELIQRGRNAFASAVVKGSALGLNKHLQRTVYFLAASGVALVLFLTAWVKTHPDDHGAEGLSAHHSNGATASPLMRNIAVSLTSCGMMAFICQLAKQPLILGYLLGGVLVGPIGLQIVDSHAEIGELSSLGLIFLLFMIGLELDVQALLKMGKVVLVTGLMQFPICAGIQIMLFNVLQAIGLSFGTGPYSSMYVGMVCAISSTMIVVKILGEKGEMESQPGRLTIGILIFQDIWAIVVLAIQPNLASPEILGILKTFGMIFVLICIAMAYAKFIMPAMLYHSSRNIESMLIMSLAWCFFLGIVAILPFIGLSMELAALIAGVALATFPYSAEFNGKIKYIRDFFITLFFAGLGMQIPMPSIGAIATGALVAVAVLIFRWLGIFLLVVLMGGGPKLGAIATLNLSQVSEFALVICSLGMGFGHINGDTMTIIIWTFAILAIASSYIMGYSLQIYKKAAALGNKLRGRPEGDGSEHGHDDHHDHRDILLLGYHKVAFMLVAEMKAKSPQLLKRIHVVDFNQDVMPKLRAIGVSCSYGDISSPDVLEHAFHGTPKIVIASIPDWALRGIDNEGLVKVSKKVWPSCHIIVTADNPEQTVRLYKAGADYVLRMAKLCAERLHDVLTENSQQAFGDAGELAELFSYFKDKDKVLRSSKGFVEG